MLNYNCKYYVGVLDETLKTMNNILKDNVTKKYKRAEIKIMINNFIEIRCYLKEIL